jgi:hypothetical protein
MARKNVNKRTKRFFKIVHGNSCVSDIFFLLCHETFYIQYIIIADLANKLLNIFLSAKTFMYLTAFILALPFRKHSSTRARCYINETPAAPNIMAVLSSSQLLPSLLRLEVKTFTLKLMAQLICLVFPQTSADKYHCMSSQEPLHRLQRFMV